MKLSVVPSLASAASVVPGSASEAIEKALDEKENQTLTIPKFLPKDYVVATTEVLKLKKGKYYSAFLDKNTKNVYIGPQIVDEMAFAIVIANDENFGVFTLSFNTAKALVRKIGTPYSDGAHGGSGYYKHLHAMIFDKIRGKTHVWYFM